ncbi:hypothetical protein [Nocardia niwae]|uniref:Uncharacterized protein n=1 Tax=Nocardia niwae TaxID=626084 RepID=A0ABV2XCD7_9NOCA
MAIEFHEALVDVPVGKGTAAKPRMLEGAVTFSGRVRTASVALSGFKFDFVNVPGTNRPMNIIEVTPNLTVRDGREAKFNIMCHYADANFDDVYRGYVKVLVIADIAE